MGSSRAGRDSLFPCRFAVQALPFFCFCPALLPALKRRLLKTSRSTSSFRPSPPPITANWLSTPTISAPARPPRSPPICPSRPPRPSSSASCSTPPSRSAPAHASLSEKLVLNHAQPGGRLRRAWPNSPRPLALTLGDTLTLMVILSDNTATNMAIDRLGLDHINATLRAAGLKQTFALQKGLRARHRPHAAPTSRSSAWARPPRAKWPRSWSGSPPATWLSTNPRRRRTPRRRSRTATAPSAARFSTCCATSRIATAFPVISKPRHQRTRLGHRQQDRSPRRGAQRRRPDLHQGRPGGDLRLHL